ncbi:activating signal cointegrator 1 complex subunit 2-like isoform X2 [Odontomachus brunneus]|uniref:activating signal cointegrator 1 complex subunit 2-like isoform X2 n=1 Tax=Odontomachus brunneus TaxID=486640 RepID=UPI0013F227CF|nr:activating signal cointegrator 1 complex subunit 2-like isoform X2 [Odontomachus brunneus]
MGDPVYIFSYLIIINFFIARICMFMSYINVNYIISRVLSIYGNTIFQMYGTLDKLAYNDECMPKYIELKHRLDVTRVELLDLYRIIVYEPISNIEKKINAITEDEVKNCIDQYLNSLMNTISEKEFIMDYHNFYPIDHDLKVVSKLYPDINYILNSLHASIGYTKMSPNVLSKGIYAGLSDIQNDQRDECCNDINYMNKEIKAISNDKLMSYISKVKEILCGYNEDFIQICLKHYNNDVESVINAVLENTLPPNLEKLNETLLYVPPDFMEPLIAVDSAINTQRLNIFNNTHTHDEFDVPAKIYRRKKKEKYKDANEMLNDKSEIDKSIYEKYSIIDEVDDYDDEYDDTYDSHNVRSSVPDTTEIDFRPFTTPRILCTNDKYDANFEDDIEIENEKSVQNIDHFIQNPVNLRARTEQRKQSTKGDKNSQNVVGKSKGQEQDKYMPTKEHKKTCKREGNQNRHTASQIKRKQGMTSSSKLES